MTSDIFQSSMFDIIDQRDKKVERFSLRDYQQKAVDSALYYFGDKNDRSGALMVEPTGCGKSLIIADIARRLKDPTVVFQPSKEILEQNFAKLMSYGVRNASIFSASAGEKRISHLTYATIGSAINQIDKFRHFKNVIIDECHLTNPKNSEAMYSKFLSQVGDKVLGLSATPFRLNVDGFNGAMLKFLTRTRPRIFHKVIHYTQTKELFDRGYLSPMQYESVGAFDQGLLQLNSTGADYTDTSVKRYYDKINLKSLLYDNVTDQIRKGRKHILVFTRFIEEADAVARELGSCAALVTGEMDMKDRSDILKRFKDGKIKVVCNAKVLVLGYDFPELDTVILSQPTRSLALYYQQIGRAIRPHPNKKSGLVIDLCDNFDRFGRIEDLHLTKTGYERWFYESNGRQLTNVPIGESNANPYMMRAVMKRNGFGNYRRRY